MFAEKNPRQINPFPVLPAPTPNSRPPLGLLGRPLAGGDMPSPTAQLGEPAKTAVRTKTRGRKSPDLLKINGVLWDPGMCRVWRERKAS